MTDEQTERRIADIQRALQARETENLLETWEQNDRETWTPEAFEAVRRILHERFGCLGKGLWLFARAFAYNPT